MNRVPEQAGGAAVGWHGKLPSTGDFVSRRLDGALLESLDEWLSALMLALREQAPTDWLPAYLASPSWCFLWMPRALPPPWQGRAWVGVVMPSVDRVGRYFPLVLIQPLAEMPRGAVEIEALWRWLQRLDQTAADALARDWSIATLEAELERLGVPAPPPPRADEGEPGQRFAAEARELWAGANAERCFWYCATDHFAPTLRSTAGLPSPELAQLLFGAAGG